MRISLILLLVSSLSLADPIFPDLQGQALLDALESAYRPTSTLSYNEARDVLYTIIDNHNDHLTCVYTGFEIYLDHNSSNPRSEAYERGINCEHTWPQSLGATGQAKSDMHHLYPTRIDVNAARGSLPFDDIPDNWTDRWWRLDYHQGSIPGSYIDEYSEEDTNTDFEPREDHKGNVARSMFYFYTMYHDQADDTFFEIQRDRLRLWHYEDPVDPAEIDRTWQIASYQQNRPNPFIIDTTLVLRAYFPELVSVPLENASVSTPQMTSLHPNYPNPFNPQTTLAFDLATDSHVTFSIYDMQGQLVKTLIDAACTAGSYQVLWDGTDDRDTAVSSGIYWGCLTTGEQTQTQSMVLLR